MALSNDLISQFVKAVSNDGEKPSETVSYGTIKISDGATYVQLDGATMCTPVASTTLVSDGDRVTVMIKDHSAVVTGNLSSPSATQGVVDSAKKELGDKINEFDIIVADKVSTEQLNAITGQIKDLAAKTLTADSAVITDLQAADLTITGKIDAHAGKFESIDASFVDVQNALKAAEGKFEELEATNADFRTLESDYGEFHNLATEKFTAIDGSIEDLETTKLSAEQADLKYAVIDLSNIGEAAIEKLFTESGIIKDLIMSDGKVTGELIGVTIKGDMIEAGTIKVDRLIVKGSDDNYYALSTDFEAMPGVTPVDEDAIHGSVLVKKSIVAEKIAVDDLHAFGATIGGFSIGDNAIYSGTKSSIDNTLATGSYLDKDGQFAFGDGVNFIRYYKTTDENGNEVYKLAISADDITFGHSGRTAEDVADLADRIKIGTYTDPDTGKTSPSIELDEEFGNDKLQLTNETIVFTSEEAEGTKITKDKISTEIVEQNGWVWASRSNGNYGLMWKGGS